MTHCPNCKQKLKLPITMLAGSIVICPQCGEHLRIVGRDPDRMEIMTEKQSLNKNGYPESYA